MKIPDTECHTCQHYKGVAWDSCSGERGDGCYEVLCAIDDEEWDKRDLNYDYECPGWEQRTPEHQAELDRQEAEQYAGDLMSALTSGMITSQEAEEDYLKELRNILDKDAYETFLIEYNDFKREWGESDE